MHLAGFSGDRSRGTNEVNRPSEFSIIFGLLPSITATAEFVVPMLCQSSVDYVTDNLRCTQIYADDLALDLLLATFCISSDK